MNKILAIDFGTTNSYGCLYINKNFEFVKNKNNYTFPSIIEFTKYGKKICENNNSNSIKNIKRLISWENKLSFEKYKKIYNIDDRFELDKDNNIYIYNEFEEKKYYLQELIALILNKIINNANNQFNCVINEIIITIPAYFDETQRNIIYKSLDIISIKCLKIINEPTAASLAYCLNYNKDYNLLVLDIGGGTCDISLLNIDENIVEVINTGGDILLGGEDFTNEIYNDFLNELLEQNIKNIDKKYLFNLCDNFKCKINYELFYKDIKYSKNRDQINELFFNLFNKINEKIKYLLEISMMKIDEINYIIFVGGSSKLDEFKYYISNLYNIKILNHIDQDLIVCMGAAIETCSIVNNTNSIKLIDVVPISIGIQSDNDKMCKIIEKGDKIPIKKFKYFTNEYDNQTEIDILIFQGENELTKYNKLIGKFKLLNIKLKDKNKNIIKVEIKVNANGLLEVNAFEKGTNNINKLRINKIESLTNKQFTNIIDEFNENNKLDEFKSKIYNLKLEINNNINILKFNCYENIIKFENIEKIDLEKFLENILKKINALENKRLNDINDFNDLFENYKKINILIKSKYKNIFNYDFLKNNNESYYHL